MATRQKWLKNIFLTYPQCPIAPRVLLDFLKDLLRENLDCCAISQELHQDGNQHLHAFVQLKERMTLNKDQFSYFFDLNYDDPCYHPNTQAARNVRNVVKYVVKGRFNGAMQDFVEYNMSCEALLAKKSPKADKIVKLMVEGKRLQEVFTAEPGYVGFNLAKFQYLQQWLDTNQSKQLDLWNPLDLSQYQLGSIEHQISTWLNANIKQRRPPRTPHLMLVGPTKTGKTWLVNTLRNYLRVYDCPVQGPYFAPWEDGKFDLIVMEELHAGWTVSDLLRFLDGSPTMLKVHGGLHRKTDNIPIIITSNQRFHQSYKKIADHSLEALETRVEVIELTHQINIFPGIVPKL